MRTKNTPLKSHGQRRNSNKYIALRFVSLKRKPRKSTTLVFYAKGLSEAILSSEIKRLSKEFNFSKLPEDVISCKKPD